MKLNAFNPFGSAEFLSGICPIINSNRKLQRDDIVVDTCNYDSFDDDDSEILFLLMHLKIRDPLNHTQRYGMTFVSA